MAMTLVKKVRISEIRVSPCSHACPARMYTWLTPPRFDLAGMATMHGTMQGAALVLLPAPRPVPAISLRHRPGTPLSEAIAARRAAQPVRRAVQQIVSSTANGADFKAWENVTSLIRKREDIKTIMLFGAGPIVIGQVGVCHMIGLWCIFYADTAMRCATNECALQI